jgi:hypothetical protein|tara:strand:+ start:3128 stop:3250 length:123 start_codon:yes stop_codon:yes gene_type:complete
MLEIDECGIEASVTQKIAHIGIVRSVGDNSGTAFIDRLFS